MKAGERCVAQQHYVEASLHFSQAIKLAPERADVYGKRSLAFLEMKRFPQALKDALHFISIQPDNSQVRVTMFDNERSLTSLLFAGVFV